MKAGIWIACIFASIWGVVGLASGGAPAWSWIAPPAVSIAIIGFSFFRRWPRAQGRHDGAWKSVAIWSGVEGLAILVAVNVLARIGASQFAVPVIAIIVGLHFFPLARGIPLASFHATGAALVAFGLAGFLTPHDIWVPVAALGAALALWTTGACLLSLGERVERQQPVESVD